MLYISRKGNLRLHTVIFEQSSLSNKTRVLRINLEVIYITISEIDKEIERLKQLRNQKEKEQLSDLNKYIGKFYRSGNDGTIGKIYKVDYSNSAKDYGILRSHCLWFDDEEFAIASDDDGLSLENIEIISEQKFVTTLNEWVKRIINFYGITL